MQDLLVHMRSFGAWPPAAEFGARLAALLQASITGAFVTPSPLGVAAASQHPPELVSAVLSSARAAMDVAQSAAQSFVRWTAERGVSQAAWHVAEGDAADALAQLGTWHDLLLLDRGSDANGHTPPELARMMLASNLPCIVVPPGPVVEPTLDCVAVGWNGSREALRAIHGALPLLQRAERVVLLETPPRQTLPEITWKPPFDIDTYLQRHAVHAEHRPLEHDGAAPGEALLHGAEETDADLLVMGAYGRSQLSEWSLGDATRHVLAHATLPVLLRH
ncbi:universal stress protein [Dyella sp.]|jgi:nucleotide-binding universal stress UspA family protein|uniref:universal stress protein n=1 Tax=Dyella sp. TaxID=1869338 RepID=UPI002D76D90F|nr:universal stress protein [Dyella sp.]HET6432801.1 universal stress protein [Dyella sp.]